MCLFGPKQPKINRKISLPINSDFVDTIFYQNNVLKTYNTKKATEGRCQF